MAKIPTNNDLKPKMLPIMRHELAQISSADVVLSEKPIEQDPCPRRRDHTVYVPTRQFHKGKENESRHLLHSRRRLRDGKSLSSNTRRDRMD
jgi:hypothetical protein